MIPCQSRCLARRVLVDRDPKRENGWNENLVIIQIGGNSRRAINDVREREISKKKEIGS